MNHSSATPDPPAAAPAVPGGAAPLSTRSIRAVSSTPTATASATCPASSSGSTMSRRSASTRSGSRRSSNRRWPTSATTSPTTAPSIRSSARSTISTALIAQRARSRPQSDHRPGAEPHLRPARLVRGEPPEPRQSARPTGTCGPTRAHDGTPPNNWLSIFGGVAWTWEPRRGQYYLHNFLERAAGPEFPQSGRCGSATLDNMRFWLDRGVDGLRLDAINFCFHDAKLRDNPPRPQQCAQGRRLQRRQSLRLPVAPVTTTRSRRCCRSSRRSARCSTGIPDVVALGEISSDDSTATVAEYTQPGRLHMALQLRAAEQRQLAAAHPRDGGERCVQRAPESWPCWTISNHDVERVVSRWGRSSVAPRMATQLSALVCSLRGSVCVFQGEELASARPTCRTRRCAIPMASRSGPTFKGRDGCRTPMPWDATERGGFSSAEPWLPVPPQHLRAVGGRAGARRLFGPARLPPTARVAQQQPLLISGDIEFLAATESVLAFRRFDCAGLVARRLQSLGRRRAVFRCPGQR